MELDQYLAAFARHPGASGLAIDFDGTLSPIVVDPEDAAIIPAAQPALESLAAKYAVVAVVSGRQAADVRQRVGLEGLEYVGLHGAEEWTEGGIRRPDDAGAWAATAANLARRAEEFLADPAMAGCTVESKGLAVSVHFRNAVHSEAGQDVSTWSDDIVRGTGFRAVAGRKVVELRPLGTSKAGAVERLVVAHQLTNLLVAGDDLTDVEAMEMATKILGPQALCIGVRSEEEPAGLVEHATLLVDSCDEFVELLTKFAEPADNAG